MATQQPKEWTLFDLLMQSIARETSLDGVVPILEQPIFAPVRFDWSQCKMIFAELLRIMGAKTNGYYQRDFLTDRSFERVFLLILQRQDGCNTISVERLAELREIVKADKKTEWARMDWLFHAICSCIDKELISPISIDLLREHHLLQSVCDELLYYTRTIDKFFDVIISMRPNFAAMCDVLAIFKSIHLPTCTFLLELIRHWDGIIDASTISDDTIRTKLLASMNWIHAPSPVPSCSDSSDEDEYVSSRYPHEHEDYLESLAMIEGLIAIRCADCLSFYPVASRLAKLNRFDQLVVKSETVVLVMKNPREAYEVERKRLADKDDPMWTFILKYYQ